VAKYKKKPIVIEAFKYDGDFMDSQGKYYIPDWAIVAFEKGKLYFKEDAILVVKTLEGEHIANVGDYIIQGVRGEIYPCKPDIFELTYDKVVDYGVS